MEVLRRLPETARIGVGVVNQKRPAIEGIEEVAEKIGHAVDLFGRERVLLHPDCGFCDLRRQPDLLACECRSEARRHRASSRAVSGIGGRSPNGRTGHRQPDLYRDCAGAIAHRLMSRWFCEVQRSKI